MKRPYRCTGPLVELSRLGARNSASEADQQLDLSTLRSQMSATMEGSLAAARSMRQRVPTAFAVLCCLLCAMHEIYLTAGHQCSGQQLQFRVASGVMLE